MVLCSDIAVLALAKFVIPPIFHATFIRRASALIRFTSVPIPSGLNEGWAHYRWGNVRIDFPDLQYSQTVKMTQLTGPVWSEKPGAGRVWCRSAGIAGSPGKRPAECRNTRPRRPA